MFRIGRQYDDVTGCTQVLLQVDDFFFGMGVPYRIGQYCIALRPVRAERELKFPAVDFFHQLALGFKLMMTCERAAYLYPFAQIRSDIVFRNEIDEQFILASIREDRFDFKNPIALIFGMNMVKKRQVMVDDDQMDQFFVGNFETAHRIAGPIGRYDHDLRFFIGVRYALWKLETYLIKARHVLMMSVPAMMMAMIPMGVMTVKVMLMSVMLLMDVLLMVMLVMVMLVMVMLVMLVASMIH